MSSIPKRRCIAPRGPVVKERGYAAVTLHPMDSGKRRASAAKRLEALGAVFEFVDDATGAETYCVPLKNVRCLDTVNPLTALSQIFRSQGINATVRHGYAPGQDNAGRKGFGKELAPTGSAAAGNKRNPTRALYRQLERDGQLTEANILAACYGVSVPLSADELAALPADNADARYERPALAIPAASGFLTDCRTCLSRQDFLSAFIAFHSKAAVERLAQLESACAAAETLSPALAAEYMAAFNAVQRLDNLERDYNPSSEERAADREAHDNLRKRFPFFPA